MYLIGKDRIAGANRLKRDIMLSPDLEMELSGINERGVRPPIVRIPVKTHLSSVILSNNPWEERELEKKLEQIRQERRRRENTLNWFQRQFFVNQVFDQDNRLRFAGDAAEDLQVTKRRQSRVAPPSGKQMHKKSRRRSSKAKQTEKGRVRRLSNSPDVEKQCQPSAEEEPDCDLDSIATISPAPKKTQKSGVKLPVIKMQALGIFSAAGKRGKISQRSTQSNGTLPSVTRIGLNRRTVSEGQHKPRGRINILSIASEPEEGTGGGNLFLTDRSADDNIGFDDIISPVASSPGQHPFQERSNRRQSLPVIGRECALEQKNDIDGIVMRLTQALPPKLMANAHENANRMLYGRRKLMTDISRRESSKNTMEDPRWSKLVDSLVKT